MSSESNNQSFEYGAGPGYGNKRASNAGSTGSDQEFKFGVHTDTKPYTGHNEYGSGTTGGAGFGNKTGEFPEKNDSTMGKLMEKAGHMMKNEGLVEKGKAKREAKGFGQDETA